MFLVHNDHLICPSLPHSYIQNGQKHTHLHTYLQAWCATLNAVGKLHTFTRENYSVVNQRSAAVKTLVAAASEQCYTFWRMCVCALV